MEEVEISHLLSAELFSKFCAQLQKDFEGAGLDGSFAETLHADLPSVCEQIRKNIPFEKNSALSGLLYRIDLSEQQVRAYSQRRPDLAFEELLTEMVIKRILQKVVLKKSFSEKRNDKKRLD